MAGATGHWPRHGEIDDPDVEPQVTRDSCGPACARLVLRLLEAPYVPTHDELYEQTGRTACNVGALARAMNECAVGSTDLIGTWTGEAVANPKDDFKALTLAMAEFTPWIAHLLPQPLNGNIGHLVVVKEIAPDGVRILDPWAPGRSYSMSVDEFAAHWSLELVWRGRSD